MSCVAEPPPPPAPALPDSPSLGDLLSTLRAGNIAEVVSQIADSIGGSQICLSVYVCVCVCVRVLTVK